MPYRFNSDLPAPVQSLLPPHAQNTYLEAFNHAFAAHIGDPRQEERAHPHRMGGGQALLREGGRQLDRPQRSRLKFFTCLHGSIRTTEGTQNERHFSSGKSPKRERNRASGPLDVPISRMPGRSIYDAERHYRYSTGHVARLESAFRQI